MKKNGLVECIRYTHKIAIINHRLQSVADGKGSFTNKD